MRSVSLLKYFCTTIYFLLFQIRFQSTTKQCYSNSGGHQLNKSIVSCFLLKFNNNERYISHITIISCSIFHSMHDMFFGSATHTFNLLFPFTFLFLTLNKRKEEPSFIALSLKKLSENTVVFVIFVCYNVALRRHVNMVTQTFK